MSSAPANPEVPLHDRVYGRLSNLASVAMLPWLVVSFVLIMAFGTPNAIITPLMWFVLISIWSYPAIVVLARAIAWVLRTYGQYDRANLIMSLPGSMGAFLFAMLVVPLITVPMIRDGYVALMASCLLSAVIANWTLGRLQRG